MIGKAFRMTGTLILTAAVGACAPVIPRAILSQVDRTIPMASVARDPEPFIGKGVLWGGTVLSIRNLKDATEMQILERPLDGNHPDLEGPSSGRFLVVFGGFVDPALYPQGTAVTVAGRVTGLRAIPMDEVEIRVPVLDVLHIHIWKPERPSDVHFGFGFGTMIH